MSMVSLNLESGGDQIEFGEESLLDVQVLDLLEAAQVRFLGM